jgi:hypothetical protein
LEVGKLELCGTLRPKLQPSTSSTFNFFNL